MLLVDSGKDCISPLYSKSDLYLASTSGRVSGAGDSSCPSKLGLACGVLVLTSNNSAGGGPELASSGEYSGAPGDSATL